MQEYTCRGCSKKQPKYMRYARIGACHKRCIDCLRQLIPDVKKARLQEIDYLQGILEEINKNYEEWKLQATVKNI